MLFSFFLSESGAYSDTVGAFLPFSVRNKGSFGHDWSFPAFSCPNKGLIRTRLVLSCLFLSESRAHSDTIGPFLPFPVRIKGSFGHSWCFLAFSCPNQGLIRTQLMLSCLFLSESRAHSDTIDPFLPFPVRIKGSFGHGWFFLAFLCPNQWDIRTRSVLPNKPIPVRIIRGLLTKLLEKKKRKTSYFL
jgi:hypothetical protein